MHIPTGFFLSFYLFVSAVVSQSTKLPKSADIYAWPVASPQPSLLARVAYDPTTLDTNVLAYDDATLKSGKGNDGLDDLVRIGFFVPTPTNAKQWVGSLVSRAALVGTGDGNADAYKPQFQLHLGPANDLYHVSLSSSSASSRQAPGTPDVVLVYPTVGASPELKKPVVVNPDGSQPEEVVEKSFFQK
jgi:hypothetical protein